MMRSLDTTEEDDPEELFGLFMKPTGKGMVVTVWEVRE